MKIFFDTEFTGLHKNTTLISIGLIDENNRIFYGEFTDYDKNQVDNWIQQNVIDNLWNTKGVLRPGITNDKKCTLVLGTKEDIKAALEKWLNVYDSVELVSDVCHYDMVLFIDIFGGAFDIPKNVNPACHDINQDIANRYDLPETWAFDKSREEIVEENGLTVDGDKHNALYDAKIIQLIYNICK